MLGSASGAGAARWLTWLGIAVGVHLAVWGLCPSASGSHRASFESEPELLLPVTLASTATEPQSSGGRKPGGGAASRAGASDTQVSSDATSHDSKREPRENVGREPRTLAMGAERVTPATTAVSVATASVRQSATIHRSALLDAVPSTELAAALADEGLQGGRVAAGPGDEQPGDERQGAGSGTAPEGRYGAGGSVGEASTRSGYAAHGPQLVTAGADPCAGLFPWHAEVSRGQVTLELAVDRAGHALPTAVVAESPPEQGFARAARDCARRLRFVAAVNEAGQPVAARSRVRLAFARH